MAQPKQTHSNFRRYLPFLVITLLAFYVLTPQFASFKHSLKTVLNADVAYLGLAVIFFTATYFAAAASYCWITYFKLKYWPTLLVQIADGFTNRIAPAGVGAVATNALYLTQQAKSKAEASYIAVLNNFIGFVAHMILLLVLLLLNKSSPFSSLNFKIPQLTLYSEIIILIVLVVGVVYWRRLKQLSVSSYQNTIKVLRMTFQRPIQVMFGIFASMFVTLFYGLCLYAVMLALNVHLTVLQIFLVLTVSVIALTITPTPGGLGGVEAGLVAAMVSFGVNPSQALSVALIYRLVTYWLPIIPGALTLEYISKRGYVANKLEF